MDKNYKVVSEESLPPWYALFSSLPAMKLVEPANQGPTEPQNTSADMRVNDFRLLYQVILPEVESYAVEVEQEEDGRWIAEIPSLPGVLSYGPSSDAAVDNARQLASRVLSSRPTGGLIDPEILVA